MNSPGFNSYIPTGYPREIRFYRRDQPFYEFTNFSSHMVRYRNKKYLTSEHLFQSLKFEDEVDQERIRQQNTPRDALEEAQRMRDRVREGWIENNISTQAVTLLHKFTQHDSLRQKLLSTEDAILIEDSPTDPFWGIGADGKGANNLGRALMDIRKAMREIQEERRRRFEPWH
ncbi:DUF1768-domain-containing protein [Serendipita vermifera]|nr:DUF1768-domain-containing protein [Serendipita vermifera]